VVADIVLNNELTDDRPFGFSITVFPPMEKSREQIAKDDTKENYHEPVQHNVIYS